MSLRGACTAACTTASTSAYFRIPGSECLVTPAGDGGGGRVLRGESGRMTRGAGAGAERWPRRRHEPGQLAAAPLNASRQSQTTANREPRRAAPRHAAPGRPLPCPFLSHSLTPSPSQSIDTPLPPALLSPHCPRLTCRGPRSRQTRRSRPAGSAASSPPAPARPLRTGTRAGCRASEAAQQRLRTACSSARGGGGRAGPASLAGGRRSAHAKAPSLWGNPLDRGLAPGRQAGGGLAWGGPHLPSHACICLRMPRGAAAHIWRAR